MTGPTIMITVEQLQAAIHKRVETFNQADYPLSARALEQVELLACQNQILGEDIASPFDVPRQNISAMDGFAFAKGSSLEAGNSITIIGESQAGSPFVGTLNANQGVRIFTGAVVPLACDTVEMQENTNFADIKDTLDKSKPYSITLNKAVKLKNNIRYQGEEIAKDEAVLSRGKRLNPTDISLLANLGIAKVSVYKPLTIGLLSTGDELVAIGEPLTHQAQIYNSNTPTLKSLLKPLPLTINDYGIIPDDLSATTQAVAQAMSECDVLISTAGVSVGDYDFLTTVIEQLGKINHYKVAMKPGKPFVFGELTQNLDRPVLYFGLPGNPLSAVVGALNLVIPALWQMTGALASETPKSLQLTATLLDDVKKSPGRVDFQRGILSQDESGAYQVSVFKSQQSHRIKQLSQANCLVVLAKDSGSAAAGSPVQVQPFPWLLA